MLEERHSLVVRGNALGSEELPCSAVRTKALSMECS